MVEIEDRTRKYTVYVTDKDNTVSGSGVLFYPGGEYLYVFTCAHVIDGLDSVRIFLLKPVDVSKDRYQVFCTDIPKEQIVYSPLDEVTEGQHKEDFVIIPVQKPEDFDIDITNYCIGECSRNNIFYTQGYPNGVPFNADASINLIEYLECLHGIIVVNVADNNRFTVRITDDFLDQGARVYELKGISGAPVWDDSAKQSVADDGMEKQGGDILFGLISSGYDTTALLSKVFAVKAQQIRVLMHDRFDILIERDIADIQDIMSVTEYKPVVFDGTIKPVDKNEADKWIEERITACRCCIDDLQLQSAIDIARDIIADGRFDGCSRRLQRKIIKCLLYCYEIADLDEEFDDLERNMISRGVLDGYDVLRHLSRSFMKRNYEETIEVAKRVIDEENAINSENCDKHKTLIACARTFHVLSRAYVEDLPVVDTIGILIDEDENFIYETDDEEDKTLIYQMIGYVYGERYHDYVRSIRFLTRAYRTGFDSIVLESLGAAYYFYSIADATDKDQIVDSLKIDRRFLYRARECFLIIIGKADRLFWEGTIRRVGMCIFNTFVFLQDNYRILTIYPDIKEHAILPEGEDENKFWRDVEIKYARIAAQAGMINTDEFSHLLSGDRLLLDTIAKTEECNAHIERLEAALSPQQMRNAGFEKYLKDTIKLVDDNSRRIKREDRLPIYIALMNMVGRGIQLFGWKQIDKLKYYLERVQLYGKPELSEAMENYLYEFEAPIDDAIIRFRTTFENNRNIQNWQELNHLYVRHGMMDKADAMYRELLAERKELISDEPEYAYRAFMEYVTRYRRDMKDALKCFLDAKESFRDTDIEGFWELELMLFTNTLNEPERFEIERKPFLERGLITDEQYHRAAFIAYLVNLNKEKAYEHNKYIKDYPHLINPITKQLILQNEEIYFLNWIRAIYPAFIPSPKRMIDTRASEVRRKYANETWHKEIPKTIKNSFDIDKTASIDAWGLYMLSDSDSLDILKKFDRIYITHTSITRLLDELSQTNNEKLHDLLGYIRAESVFRLQSANFRTQLEVRDKVIYDEAASAVAMGIEKDCITILGEPELNSGLVAKYKSRIIRVSDIEMLIS